MPASALQDIEKLVCVLVVWLHVKAGCSRAVSNAVLQAAAFLIDTVFTILVAALASQGVKVKLPHLAIPRDIRTAYKKYFPEPKITRKVCCPDCLHTSEYPIDEVPLTCTYRTSPRSKPCGASLFRTVRTRKGDRTDSSCLLTTQSFSSWIPSFVKRKPIDDALHEHFRNQRPDTPNEFHDVRDSPGYKAIYGDDDGPYNLVFGIYVDWFQVFKMKIAGTGLNARYGHVLSFS